MSKYPGELDTNAEIPAVSDNITETGTEAINGLIEAMFAVQAALGVDPQGAAVDLTTRLANALNDDGTLKASALVAAGLIALPVTNSMIGPSAAIEESKLNLDVSTQSLQNQIASNDIDIATLQDQLAIEIARVTKHVLGLAERHSSTHIDHSLADGYALGSGATLQTAVDYIWGTFLAHRDAIDTVEHYASAIKYIPQGVDPGEVPVITATDVQGAISEIDDQFKEDRRKHNDSAHTDGISKDGYVYLGGQAAVNDASLRVTRFQSASPGPDIMKLGLCNAATVKTKGFSVNSISASANSLGVTATSGTNTKSITITNVHLGGANQGVYPSGTGKLSLKGIVDSINGQFADNSFPVTAFESDDGELVLQHNIARNDCTLQVTSPALSMTDEIGFTDIVGQEVYRQEVYRFVVNGIPYTELKTLSDGYLTQGALSTTIDLGVDVTATGLDLRTNMLLHIYDHSAGGAASGTYRITSVSAGTTVTVHTAVAAGSFAYIIYNDTFNTNLAGGPWAVDMYIDDSRDLYVSERAEVTVSQLAGIASLIGVSQGFDGYTATSLNLTKSGTTYSLSITTGDDTGVATNFEEGFIGRLKVYHPNNIDYASVQVIDTLPASPRSDTLTFYDTDIDDSKLLLGTTHIRAGAAIVEIPNDVRNVGLVGASSIGTDFLEGTIEDDIANLHLSGVVRGFDIISNDSDSIVLNGGTAYVAGKKISLERVNVDITTVASSSGTWNLVLEKDASLRIYNDSTSGYSIGEAIRFDDFIVLAQFTISAAPAITSYQDTRFFINDIDSRTRLTVDDRDLGAGSFRSLDSAILYSRYAPNDTKPEIIILSDYTASNDFTSDSGARIVSYNNLTFSQDLTLTSNSVLEVWGTLTCQGQVFIQSGAKLVCKGTSSFSGNIDLFTDAHLSFEDAASVPIIQVSGDNVRIYGTKDLPVVTFSGTGDGIQTSGARANLEIRDLDLSMTLSTNSVLSFQTNVTGFVADNVKFRQATTLTDAQLTTAMAGLESASGTHTGIKIRNCEFTNIGAGIMGDGATWNNLEISNTEFSDFGTGVQINSADTVRVSECIFSNIHNSCFLTDGTVQEIIIESCVFKDEFAVGSTAAIVINITNLDEFIFKGNIVTNISTASLLIIGDTTSSIVSSNIFYGCTTTSHAISMETAANSVFSENNIANHTGEVISATNTACLGNNINTAGTASGTSVRLRVGSDCVPFEGNKIVISDTSDSVSIRNYVMSGNFIEAGSVSIQGSGDGFNVTGNIFNLTNTSAANSLTLDSSSTEANIFNSNKVIGAGTTSTIYVDDGIFQISGNYIDGSSTQRAITVGNNYTASTNIYNITDNHIQAGTAYSMYIDASNVNVSGNLTTGSVSGDDILVTSGKDNIFITGNLSNTSGAGAGSIRHADSSPTNVYIGMNKNVETELVYSVLSASQSGTWTRSVALPSTAELVSASTNDTLLIPLTGLPAGAQLNSVSLVCDTPGGAGEVNIYLLKRQASTGTSTSQIGTAANLAINYQSITVSLAPGTQYIDPGEEYILYVTSSTAGNKMGQVVVKVSY